MTAADVAGDVSKGIKEAEYVAEAGEELKNVSGLANKGKAVTKGAESAENVVSKGSLNSRIYKKGFDNHLVSGTLGKGQKGVVGGHNYDEFKQVLTDAGYDVNDCIVNINNHPTIEGIYEVEYRIPARKYGPNGDLVVIPGQYKTIAYPKTVYDPSIIADTQMIQWGKEAMESGAVNGREIVGYSSNGLKFKGYVDTLTGEITNFYPVLEE